MELIMFAVAPTHRSSSLKGRANHFNGKFAGRLMCVSNATAKATGRVNVMHAPSKCGGAIIVIRSSTRGNRPNVTNVRVGRVGARVAVGTATDVDGRDTGPTSVMLAFKTTGL